MLERDPRRTHGPWDDPGDDPTAMILFLVLVILFIAVAVALFVGTGLMFPSTG